MIRFMRGRGVEVEDFLGRRNGELGVRRYEEEYYGMFCCLFLIDLFYFDLKEREREMEEIVERVGLGVRQRLSCWILMGIMLRRYFLGKNEWVGINAEEVENPKKMQKVVP